jgi:hypothetical protein
MGEEEKIRKNILELQSEHKALSEQIDALIVSKMCDQLLLQRFKRKKLQLKDQISDLQSFLCDDIIA